MHVDRRQALCGSLALLLAACGGGGSSDAPATAGSSQTRYLASTKTGSTYPIFIYLPPGASTDAGTWPVVYLLDAESRFETMVGIVRSGGNRAIVVGIGNEAIRSRDYVPLNSCTAGGGGHAAFFDFIRLELTPYIEANIGGDPKKRILLGHSHGGSFVLYALYAQPADGHHFASYLASDASIACMPTTVYGWDAAYAAANTALPVRLHLSWGANIANVDFSAEVTSRHYSALRTITTFYPGGHIGMIPAAFADALAFALAP